MSSSIYFFRIFFFNDTATTEIYTLSLHDALPISHRPADPPDRLPAPPGARRVPRLVPGPGAAAGSRSRAAEDAPGRRGRHLVRTGRRPGRGAVRWLPGAGRPCVPDHRVHAERRHPERRCRLAAARPAPDHPRAVPTARAGGRGGARRVGRHRRVWTVRNGPYVLPDGRPRRTVRHRRLATPVRPEWTGADAAVL